MSKIEVNTITQQCGPSLTVGGGACKSVTLDATTVTLGRCGATVSLAAGATQTGFGRTGTVDWCTTAKTAPFTGVSGKGYFVNTTCGAVTVTLPATPTAGDIISIKDYARTAATNNINFCRNGSKMDGVCNNGSIKIGGESTTLIYVDGTQGWTSILDSTTENYGKAYVTATGGTITTCGDYKTHIFTSSGVFCVSCAGNPAGSTTVDYLVVAGGGGGGGAEQAGGGGAGGFRNSNGYGLPAPTMSPLSGSSLPVSVTSYPITIGGGGSGGGNNPTPPSVGVPGSNSVFSTITSTGGGGGGRGDPGTNSGLPGGSGGGSSSNGPAAGGSGNTPPTSPSQGNDGGSSSEPPGTPNNSGAAGGGGAGAVGTNASPDAGGPGGIGSYVDNTFFQTASAPIYGEAGPVSSTRYFAGGGGGGMYGCCVSTLPRGEGGIGGGGDGGRQAPTSVTVTATAGVANTGGGGGASGTGAAAGAAGGSGIVSYKIQVSIGIKL
jgi:hypothetical protein